MKRYYNFLRGRIRFAFYELRGLLGSIGCFGESNPPVFLVGTPNSGTTIFAHGVSAHPEIRYGSNASVLWHRNAHLRGENARREADDVTPADRRRLRGNYAYYQWRSSEQYVMNRNARNSFRIHYIKEVFPESLIIHIVRDGRAVVRSNLLGYDGYEDKKDEIVHAFDKFVIPPRWRDWLERPPIEQYAFMWNETTMYASRAGQKYGRDYVEVRYEELPQNAEEVLGDIWSRLGLSPDPGALENVPDFENRNYKWKQQFDREQIDTVNEIAREGLQFFGYLEPGDRAERNKGS